MNNFSGENLQVINIVDTKRVGNIFYIAVENTGVIAIDITLLLESKVIYILKERSIAMKNVQKIAIYNQTMVLVVNDQKLMNTLIELNYYSQDESKKEDTFRWNFNRAIGYLTKINKI